MRESVTNPSASARFSYVAERTILFSRVIVPSVKGSKSMGLPQNSCSPYCFDHARRIGSAFPGYVVRGPVVGRGSDDREPHSDIHAAVKGDHLERHQALIVIHADNDIVVALVGAVK